MPKKSEFKRVLQRRKSRQSVLSPVAIDFEFCGNTAPMEHIIKQKNVRKEALTFDLNLRNYKNSTKFTAEEPFAYPGTKNFSPREQFKSVQAGVSQD